MAIAQYTDKFWYPSGVLATGVLVRVFPLSSNILAPLFADLAGTIPLANPLTTDGTGSISFFIEAGEYWLHADSEAFQVSIGLPVVTPGELAALQAEIDAVEVDVTVLQGEMNTAQADITAVEGDVTTLQGDVTSLQTDLGLAVIDIGVLQGEMVTAQGDINTLQSDVTTLQGDVTAVEGDITTLQNDMTSVQGDVTALQGDVSTLQTDVNAVEADVTTLQGAMTTAQADIITLQQNSALSMSTGVAAGGDISVSVTPSSIDIAPFIGYFVDVLTNPFAPTVTRVNYAGATVAMDAAALLRSTTYWLMNSALAIVQQATPPTNAQNRTHIFLGVTFQAGGIISIDQSLPVILQQPANQLGDLMNALGAFSLTGNRITPNGANLSINQSAGTVFAQAFNHFVGPTQTNDPHVSNTVAQTPVSLRYATQSSVVFGALRTTLDVPNYDVGGVITAIGGTSNRSTIHRVFVMPANAVADQVVVQYGQTVYTDLGTAVASIGAGTTSYVVNPTLKRTAALVAYIACRRDATDASITTQCVFTTAGKFPTP